MHLAVGPLHAKLYRKGRSSPHGMSCRLVKLREVLFDDVPTRGTRCSDLRVRPSEDLCAALVPLRMPGPRIKTPRSGVAGLLCLRKDVLLFPQNLHGGLQPFESGVALVDDQRDQTAGQQNHRNPDERVGRPGTHGTRKIELKRNG